MSTRERFEKMLYDHGMFPDQAKQVMSVAVPEMDAILPDYRITWDRPAEEYPEPFYTSGWLTVRKIAAKWIEENCPKAWFRPMFDDDLAKEIGLYTETV